MTTIQVNFDLDQWLYVPQSWPWNGFDTAGLWADTISGLLTDAYGLDPAKAAWLNDSLRAIESGCPADESRFVYLADPDRLVFFVSVLYNATSDELTLEDLAAVDDPSATRAPDVVPFSSPELGEGVRAVRYVDAGEPDHEIAAIAQYAWKSGSLDIIVVAANFNVVLLGELLPVVDELARSIRVVES